MAEVERGFIEDRGFVVVHEQVEELKRYLDVLFLAETPMDMLEVTNTLYQAVRRFLQTSEECQWKQFQKGND